MVIFCSITIGWIKNHIINETYYFIRLIHTTYFHLLNITHLKGLNLKDFFNKIESYYIAVLKLVNWWVKIA